MTAPQHTPPNPARGSDGILLNDILQMMAANWYWFALSVGLCLGAAYIYLAATPRSYRRTATILVKDSRKGGDVELSAFSDLSGFQSRRSVDNELFVLRSRRLMERVVRRLGLDTEYAVKQALRERPLYGTSPVEVRFLDDPDSREARMSISLSPDGGLRIEEFELPEGPRRLHRRGIESRAGDTLTTPAGRIVVDVPRGLPEHPVEVRVRKRSLDAATNRYRSAVRCDVANKQASVVTVAMTDVVPERAEQVIDALVAAYNEDAVAEKRRTSVVTADFIRERLDLIGRELGEVDRSIETIKRESRMVDIGSEAARNIEQSSRYRAEELSLENQLAVAGLLSDRLDDPDRTHELIPLAASVANGAVAELIGRYNDAVMNRNRLLENSSPRNPVIGEMDRTIEGLKRSVAASLDALRSSLRLQLEALNAESESAVARIESMPGQEKALLGVARQQKIKQELYLYLLNKLEEAQLNYAVAESNARIIDRAYGSPQPVAPRPSMVLLVAGVTGLAIPFALIALGGLLDTTVHGRKEIEEQLSVPLLGDIPCHEGRGERGVAVREAGRDPVSEAFRILRSNLAFMNVSAGNEIRSILFTSTNPHAGKTFVALNLAVTLAFAGKRVLVADLDFRRHALSSLLGLGNDRCGMTAYLAGSTDDIAQIIRPSGIHPGLEVICAGPQPPNPTEMLLAERLDRLVGTLKERYDLLLLDSTPALSVADAAICDRLADLCIYIVREGMLDRRQLPDIERLYREKRFRNMCIVLNGTKPGKHGYGYGYGYGYGEERSDESDGGRIAERLRRIADKVRRRYARSN